MIFVIDIGNSDITIGLSNKIEWLHIWRISSGTERPEIFYGIKLRDYFSEAEVSPSDVEKIVISSVVPNLTDKIINVTITYLKRVQLFLVLKYIPDFLFKC